MTAGPLRPGPRSGVAVALGAALAMGSVGSCARQGAPSGGPPDRLPPEVIATRPDTLARVESAPGPVRFEFSERISERPSEGTMDDAVLVSPRTGDIRVSHEGSALEVELDGGFRPGLVYRIQVLPVVEDLFGNALAEPFELVFSTGGEYFPTAVAGRVVDRITGQEVPGAAVAAEPEGSPDGEIAYASRSDEGGIYTLRYLPPGRYTLWAFRDLDLDREPGSFEPQGERVLILAAADTVLGGEGDVVILAPDTSAALLAQANLQDSLRVELAFDDYLDPTQPLDAVEVSLEAVPDTTEEGVTTPPPPPEVERLIHQREFQARLDSLAEVWARVDSVARTDSAEVVALAIAGGDTLAAEDSTVLAEAAAVAGSVRAAEGFEAGPPGGVRPAAAARGPAAGPGGGEALLPDGTPLPSRTLILLLEDPAALGATVRVRIAGAVNVNGVEGGGGEATFTRPEEPDPEGEEPDTGVVAPPDTGVAALPDTGAAVGPWPRAP